MTSDLKDSKMAAGVPLIIITGESGAGKTAAMRFMEDLGCFCVDNLPPGLIPTFFNLYDQSYIDSAGVVIVSDVRSGALFTDFVETIETLKEEAIEYELLFLECSKETLIRRFKEVRRSHPLQAAGFTMENAIKEERKRLVPIRESATQIIDTSDLSSADLRRALVRTLVNEDVSKAVTIHVSSFGFKYGLPRDADFIFDVRFLANPFYEETLRNKTGEDKDVYEYVMKAPQADIFYKQACALIETTLDPFIEKGKTAISIGVGCTGGRHRSVAFARRLSRHFAKRGTKTMLFHRDMIKPQQ